MWKIYRACCRATIVSVCCLFVLAFLAAAGGEDLQGVEIVASFFATLLAFLLLGMPVVAKSILAMSYSRRIKGSPWSDRKLMRLHPFLYALHIAFVAVLCWMLITVNFGFHPGFHWSHLSSTDWFSMITLVLFWLIILASAYSLPLDILIAKKLHVNARKQPATAGPNE